jgi:metal-responsive CopG/Arc/MetJ family transcriptional regulator
MAKRVPIGIKFDSEVVDRVDRLIAALPYPTTRTAFIEIAVKEKLEREERLKRKQ